jgi:hypothetical protein
VGRSGSGVQRDLNSCRTCAIAAGPW